MVMKITFSLYYLPISPSLLFPITIMLVSSVGARECGSFPLQMSSTGIDVCMCVVQAWIQNWLSLLIAMWLSLPLNLGLFICEMGAKSLSWASQKREDEPVGCKQLVRHTDLISEKEPGVLSFHWAHTVGLNWCNSDPRPFHIFPGSPLIFSPPCCQSNVSKSEILSCIPSI